MAKKSKGSKGRGNGKKAKTHRWKNKETYYINDDLKKRNKVGMASILDKLKLVLGSDKVALTGNRALEEKSLSTYNTYFRGMRYFLSIVGDYESLIILSENRPKFCPCIHAERICQFISFKRLKKGEPLLDTQGRPVMDVYGKAVTCQGGWNDPDCVKSLKSSIVALHTAAENSGQFCERCEDCVALDRRDDYHGCVKHRMAPQLWQRGDPTSTETVKNAIKKSNKAGSAYVAQGDSPLSPWEVATLRRNLVNTNRIEDLQLFVIILVAIKLFLRSDEFLTIRSCDLNWELTLINDDHSISSLCIKIQGKTDANPVNLMLHADDDNPELCPVRHLMAYLALINFKEGYLFPNKDVILRGDGVVHEDDDVYEYSAFMDRFTTLCRKFFNRKGPFGTHTCRKTAYLFAIWGGGPDDETMAGARHKTLKSAMRYKKDSSLLHYLALKKNYNNFQNLVPKWKPIYLQEIQMAREIIDETTVTTIAQYLQTFLRHIVKLSSNSQNFTQVNVLTRIWMFKRKLGHSEALQHLLDSMDDQGLASLISSHIAGMMHERLQTGVPVPETESETKETETSIVAQAQTIDNSALMSLAQVSDSAPQTIGKRKRKRKDNGQNDLPRRSSIAKATGSERLKIIIQLNEEASTSNDLTERARTYVVQNVTPVVKCFNNHFHSNEDQFLIAWKAKNYRYTKFAKICTPNACGLQQPDVSNP